jgi:hypothetical protein
MTAMIEGDDHHHNDFLFFLADVVDLRLYFVFIVKFDFWKLLTSSNVKRLRVKRCRAVFGAFWLVSCLPKLRDGTSDRHQMRPAIRDETEGSRFRRRRGQGKASFIKSFLVSCVLNEHLRTTSNSMCPLTPSNRPLSRDTIIVPG